MPRAVMKTSAGQKVLSDAQYFLRTKDQPKRTLQLWIEEWIQLRNRTVAPMWAAFRRAAEADAFSPHWDLGALDSLSGYNIRPARVRDDLRATLARTYSRTGRFLGRPLRSRIEGAAEHFTQALNADWKMARHDHREIRYGIQSAVLTGVGAFCTTYDTDYDKAANARRRRLRLAEQLQKDPNLAGIHSQMVVEQENAAPDLRGQPNEMTFEQDARMLKDRISTFHVPSEMLIIDPQATGAWDARFVGRFFFASAKSVSRDPRFNAAARKDATNAKHVFGSELYEGLFKPHGQDLLAWYSPGASASDLVCGYEVYVLEDDGTYTKVVALWGADEDQDLMRVESAFDFGHPYTFLRWNDYSDRFLCAPDPLHYWSHVIEERSLRSRHFDASMRQGNEVYAVDGEAISEEELRKFTYVPGVGLMCRLRNLGGKDLRQVITPLPKQNLNSDVFAYSQILERDFSMAQGRGANQQMQAMKSDTSANEANNVARMSQSIEDLKVANVEDALSDIGTKRLQLICQFFDGDRIGGLAGPAAREWFEKNSPDARDISDELGITVEKGSTAPLNGDTYLAELRNMLIESAQDQGLNALYDRVEIAKERMRVMGVPGDSKLLRKDATGDQIAQAGALSQLIRPGGGGSPAKAPGRSNAEVR